MTAHICLTVSHMAPAERHMVSRDASYPVGRRWSGKSLSSPSTGSHMYHLCDASVISCSPATLCISSSLCARLCEHHHLNWGYWRGGPSSCHTSCLQVEGFMFCLFKNTTAFISCSYIWAVGQNSPPTGRDHRVGSTHWRFWRPEAAPLSWAESPPARSPSPVWPAQEAPRRTWEHTAEFTCAPPALNQS